MHVFFFLFDLSCFFLFKITRPSNNFEFSKLPVTNPEHDFFPGNFLFVRLQIKLFSKIIFAIILAAMVPLLQRTMRSREYFPRIFVIADSSRDPTRFEKEEHRT